MQAKKRAKSVQFGTGTKPPKPTVTHEAPHAHQSPKEETQPARTSHPTIHYPEKIPEFQEPVQDTIHTEQYAPHSTPTAPTPIEDEQIQVPYQSSEEEVTSQTPIAPEPEIIEEQPSTHEEPHHNPQPPADTSQNIQEYEKESFETAPQTEETYVVEKEIKKNMLGYFILIAIISFFIGIGSMAGANYIMKNSQLPKSIPYLESFMTTPTPTPEPTSIPTPTEKKIDLTAYNIEVLNGSGITGAAAGLKESLTTDGFKIISTGNADKSDYTQTIIQTSKNIDPDFLSKLKENLKSKYQLGTDTAIPVDYTGKADIIITIGSTPK